MKNKILLVLILSGFMLSAKAQKTTTTTTVISNTSTYFDNKVIIDSAGTVLTVDKWRPLLNTGTYTLKSKNASRDTMQLVKMNAEELALMESMMPAPPQSDVFPVGAKMEMFEAKDITGKKIKPKELKGKIIVLNFWFIACPPCKAEIPELNKIVAEYVTNPDVVFIAVCLDQRWEIKDFMKKQPFNYMQVADGRSYSDGYNVKAYPTNVVIDKQGIIRFSSAGYGPSIIKYLKNTIEINLAKN